MSSKTVLVMLFVLGAALSWGHYVPLVHVAAQQLKSNLRAFLFVGVAYFLVAVLVPMVMIFLFHYDPTAKGQANFHSGPVMWGITAGIAGAIGALFVIFAVTTAGKGGALYVAPLVFAGAPIVNTLATMLYFHPTKNMPDWRFFLGLAMAAGGAALVMLYKPAPEPSHVPPTQAVAAVETPSPAAK